MGCSSGSLEPKPPYTLGDTSRTSVDWMGAYTGVIPCADCEGIRTDIILSEEGFYRWKQEYLGKSSQIFDVHGTFTWDETGGNVLLKGVFGEDKWLRVGENKVDILDKNKHLIISHTGNYTLQKKSFDRSFIPTLLEENYLKFIEINEDKYGIHDISPYLFLDKQEKRFYGFGGCNRLMGIYKISDDNRILFSSIASTRMTCPKIQIEQNVLDILQKSQNYSIKNGIVTLFDDNKKALGWLKIVLLD